MPFTCVAMTNFDDNHKSAKFEVLKLLLQAGADINAKDQVRRMSTFFYLRKPT